jgi:hypothetical protein
MKRWHSFAVLLLLPYLVISSSRPQAAQFDPDPQDPANRLFRHLYSRTMQDGKVYDQESLDPIFLPGSKFLTEGASQQQAVALLDEFFKSQAKHPLKALVPRAILQRDLWGVFGTSTGKVNPEYLEMQDGRVLSTLRPLDGGDAGLGRPRERRELQRGLALAMRSIALTAKEIDALPDNLAEAVKSGTFPEEFDPKNPAKAFLPTDLLAPAGPWVAVMNASRGDQLAAPQHLQFTKGRSVFTVFLRLPGGRRETEAYLLSLIKAENERQELPKFPAGTLKGLPQLPAGAKTAILRQMLLVDDQGKLRATRLTESLQINVLDGNNQSNVGHSFAFKLRRADLFADRNGGLYAVDATETSSFDFETRSGSNSDPFEVESKEPQPAVALLSTCRRCHAFSDRLASVNVLRAGMLDRPALVATDPKEQAGATMHWVSRTYSWGLLQGLWESRTEK